MLRNSLFLLLIASSLATAKHRIQVHDVYKMAEVSSPRVSPDGKWVAYQVETINKEEDKPVSNIWMAAWDGSADIQLTFETKESASSPEWSPDGRYISFVSSRPGPEKGSQVWIMDRRGGEARQLTHLKNFGLTSYRWSPDSKHLLLVLKEKEHPDAEEGKPEKPEPEVITRYHFKEDEEGYLSGQKRNHIYIFDIESGKLDQITHGPHDDRQPEWSPDGSRIAYITSLDADPDRTQNSDVFVIESHAGAEPKRLTTFPGPDKGPLSWSPDSKFIAYLQGSESKLFAYNMDHLALLSADGGAPRLLSQKLDRDTYTPIFSEDGKSITVLVPDDRIEYAANVSLNGQIEKVAPGQYTASEISQQAGHLTAVISNDGHPDEIYALEASGPRQISHRTDALAQDWELGSVQNLSAKSKDGTEVHGLITFPPDYTPGKQIPLILRIHGGPNGQDSHEFRFDNQLLAAQGWAILNVNYRGSNGRGAEYAKSIFADWGNKEVADLLAVVDSTVKSGIADPKRLAIGGWSYGAISTDYTIAATNEFRCAIAGAGSANWFGIYGIDEYTYQYDNELGYPWVNTQAWLKLSSPFFHIDRIKTPTLFMGGDKDFNVPIAGSEQMYEALKTLGVETELVIYPGEFHEFKRPSFITDRYRRYINWYSKHLQ